MTFKDVSSQVVAESTQGSRDKSSPPETIVHVPYSLSSFPDAKPGCYPPSFSHALVWFSFHSLTASLSY